MTDTNRNHLRIFLVGAFLLAASAAIVVWGGVLSISGEKEFDQDAYASPAFGFRIVGYSELDGWLQDDLRAPFAAFVISCEKMMTRSPSEPANPFEALGLAVGQPNREFAGMISDWTRPCEEARSMFASDHADRDTWRTAIRRFFENYFVPVQMIEVFEPLPDGPARRFPPKEEEIGVFTGYFEPSYGASRTQSSTFSAPVYTRPADLVEVDLGKFRTELAGERIAGRVKDGILVPYEDRTDIERGDPGRTQVIAWMDPNDLFFLQIQGSGRLVFDDGQVMRVGYAGQNGHPYTAIGRVMVERRILPLEQVSMQSIRDWLNGATLEEASELRAQNKSYVFFTERNGIGGELGPLGSQGVALTPRRSIAVDRRFIPLGAPVWVSIEAGQGAPIGAIKRLFIAQDTGGAIRGAIRGDIFWGHGDEAGDIAGAMNARGKMVVLLPYEAAGRLAQSARQ